MQYRLLGREDLLHLAEQPFPLGLIELVFSYAVSRRLFRERLSRLELGGMALLALGVGLIMLVP